MSRAVGRKIWQHSGSRPQGNEVHNTVKRVWPIAASLILLGACYPLNDRICSTDEDCGVDECSNNGECITAGTSISVRVFWTIAGDQANEQTCEANGFEELSISFVDEDTFDNIVFRPVTCGLGRILYNKIPPRIDTVALQAHSANGRQVAREAATLTSAENEFSFDLRPSR